MWRLKVTVNEFVSRGQTREYFYISRDRILPGIMPIFHSEGKLLTFRTSYLQRSQRRCG